MFGISRRVASDGALEHVSHDEKFQRLIFQGWRKTGGRATESKSLTFSEDDSTSAKHLAFPAQSQQLAVSFADRTLFCTKAGPEPTTTELLGNTAVSLLDTLVDRSNLGQFLLRKLCVLWCSRLT